jgi:hypothetical protein
LFFFLFCAHLEHSSSPEFKISLEIKKKKNTWIWILSSPKLCTILHLDTVRIQRQLKYI